MRPTTFAAIRDAGSGESYPRHVLELCETALILFSAGFHGRQDAYWIAEAGLQATCVDLDAKRLGEMRKLYPEGWEFFHEEAFAFAATTDREWDLVSIDCPSGSFDRCAGLVETWCRLARVAVVLGSGLATNIEPPSGWHLTDLRHRSNFAGGTYCMRAFRWRSESKDSHRAYGLSGA